MRAMLPMERLQEILGLGCDLSEAEFETLRREMHELAEIIVEAASVRLGRPASEIAEPTRRPRLVQRGVSDPGNLPALQGLGATGDRAQKGGSPQLRDSEPREARARCQADRSLLREDW